MSDNEKWGPGRAVNDRAYATASIGNERVELIFGEHPHSRQDNRTYARDRDGNITPFSGHRNPVAIEIEEYNYLKSSGLSGDDIRRQCRAKIKIDGKHIYTLHQMRDHTVALTRLPDVVAKLLEHPVRFWEEGDVGKLAGRQVFYRDQPALVKCWDVDSGVLLVPESGRFRASPWLSDPEDRDEEDSHASVYCDVLSPSIYWWRD